MNVIQLVRIINIFVQVFHCVPINGIKWCPIPLHFLAKIPTPLPGSIPTALQNSNSHCPIEYQIHSPSLFPIPLHGRIPNALQSPNSTALQNSHCPAESHSSCLTVHTHTHTTVCMYVISAFLTQNFSNALIANEFHFTESRQQTQKI